MEFLTIVNGICEFLSVGVDRFVDYQFVVAVSVVNGCFEDDADAAFSAFVLCQLRATEVEVEVWLVLSNAISTNELSCVAVLLSIVSANFSLPKFLCLEERIILMWSKQVCSRLPHLRVRTYEVTQMWCNWLLQSLLNFAHAFN